MLYAFKEITVLFNHLKKSLLFSNETYYDTVLLVNLSSIINLLPDYEHTRKLPELSVAKLKKPEERALLDFRLVNHFYQTAGKLKDLTDFQARIVEAYKLNSIDLGFLEAHSNACSFYSNYFTNKLA